MSKGEEVLSSMGKGLLILLGIADGDNTDDVEWLVRKTLGLRIFDDADGKMNLNLKDADGDVTVVSQFTLYASTRKGNRPSFTQAARPEEAVPLYEEFLRQLREQSGIEVGSGEFGADMQVRLVNDGPVTIIIDSKERH